MARAIFQVQIGYDEEEGSETFEDVQELFMKLLSTFEHTPYQVEKVGLAEDWSSQETK